MSAPTPAPGDDRPREGYYPDPSIPGYVRYWNGASWVPGTSRPAPKDGESLAPPPGAGAAQPAPVEETGPHFFDEDPVEEPSPADAQHGSRPEPASAWGADRSHQSGFGGDQDRRVSWGAPQGAQGAAQQGARSGDPRLSHADRRPDGESARADGTANTPPSGQEANAAAGGGTFVFRRPTGQGGGGAAADAPDDGTMTFRAVSPRPGPAGGGSATPGGAGQGGAAGSGFGPAGSGGPGGGSAVPGGVGQGGAAGSGFGPAASGAAGQGNSGGSGSGFAAAGPGGGSGASPFGGQAAAAGSGFGPAGSGGGAAPAAFGAGPSGPAFGAQAGPTGSQSGSAGPGFGAGKAAAARASAAQTGAASAAAQASGAAPSVLSGPQAAPPVVPAQSAGPGAAAPLSPGPGGGQSSWAQQVHRLAGGGEGGDEQPVAPWKPPVEDVFQAAARRQAEARPAGLGKRLVARLLDTVVLAALTAVAAVPLGTKAVDHVNEKIDAAKLSGETVTVWLLDGTTSVCLGIILAVLLLAGVLCEVLPTARWGRTLGKKLTGLEVRDIEGHDSPDFGAALRRWLVYSVPGLLVVGLVGVAWCLFDRPWRQCWHDKAAHTFVAG
ncbi:RDD family protein [Streptomyces sp. NPDC050698]